MQHPKPEEWIPFLFGEADGDHERRLKTHLDECERCAAQLAGWSNTVGSLDRWKLPRVAPVATPRRVRTSPLALAAAVVIGLFAGRLIFPPSSARPSEAFQAAVRTEVETQMRRALLALNSGGDLKGLENRVRNELEATEAKLLEQARAQTETVVQKAIEQSSLAREEDRLAVLALFKTAREQQQVDYYSLRKDLETVASLTDEALRHDRQRIIQLSSQGDAGGVRQF